MQDDSRERHEMLGRLVAAVVAFVLTVIVLSLAERFVGALERLANAMPTADEWENALERATQEELPPPRTRPSWKAARRAARASPPPLTPAPEGSTPEPGPDAAQADGHGPETTPAGG